MPEKKTVKLLVIEDVQSHRHSVSRMLSAAGFSVHQAASGAEALTLIPTVRPDIIISDVTIPGLDGLDVCRMLEKDPATKHIPVIMISADLVRGTDYARGLDSGADAYLTAPVEQPVLLATIRGLLRSRRAEKRLRENEKRFRIMADGLPFMIWVHDAQGQLELVNQKYCEFFGVTSEQVRGFNWQPLLHPDDGPAYIAEFLACVHDRRPFHAVARVRHVDGQWRWIESHGQPRFSAKGQFLGFVGSSPDITEQRQQQQALRESRELLQSIIDRAPAAIYAKDLAGRFILSNRYHASLMGCTPDEIHGRTDAEIAPTASRSNEYRENDRRVVESGQAIECEEIAPGPDREEHVYLSVKFPLRQADGTIYGICGISTDITQRKQMEEDLARSNAELERFATVVSHDLRSPMTTLSGCAQLLKMELADSDRATVREAVDYMQGGVMQMNRLITALLTYSRIGQEQVARKDCPMDDVFAQVLKAIKSNLESVQATVTAAPLPVVKADAVLLAQLLQNLIENAIKYRSESEPQVHIEAVQRGTDWVFSVRDNGIGIAPEHRERVFGAFQRLHADESKYAGLGLGLATCRRIVERHGGRIWVESTPGQGSTFFFSLPVG